MAAGGVLEEAEQAFYLSRLEWFGVGQRFHIDEKLAHEVEGKGQIRTRPHGVKGHEQLC